MPGGLIGYFVFKTSVVSCTNRLNKCQKRVIQQVIYAIRHMTNSSEKIFRANHSFRTLRKSSRAKHTITFISDLITHNFNLVSRNIDLVSEILT